MSGYKSTIDWPAKIPTLPTRDGTAQGKRMENRALSNIGGPDQIRTKLIDNQDGSRTMLKTRAGMPEFVTTGRTVPPRPATDRTFVFSEYLSVVGVIANRIGAAMNVLKTGVKVLFASYNVANTGIGEGNWRDVWRLDRLTSPDSRMKINAAAQTVQTTLSETSEYDAYPIPYIYQINNMAYPAANPNDALYSTLYLGISVTATPSTDGQKFLAIKKDGTEGTTVVPTNATTKFYPCWSAGLRASSDGVYRYYGGRMAFVGTEIQTGETITSWSEITTSLTAPLVAETGYATDSKFKQGYATYSDGIASFDFTPFLTQTIEYTGNYPALGNTPGSWDAGVVSVKNLYDYTENIDDPDYAYPGSDIALHFRCLVGVLGEARFATSGAPYPVGIFTYTSNTYPTGGTVTAEMYGPFESVERTTTMTYSLTSAHDSILPLLVGAFSFSEASGKYGPVSGPQINEIDDPMHPGYKLYSTTTVAVSQSGPTPVTYNYDLAVSTRDYIYCDLDEEVSLTFETTLHLTKTGSTPAQTLVMDYVLNIRGTEHRWNVPFDLDDLLLVVGFSPAGEYPIPEIVALDGWTSPFTKTTAMHTWGFYPVGIFNPYFMHQGNCPWIAYTTKEEEAQGATPEFYLDLSVNAVTYSSFSVSTASEQGRYKTNTISFAPHQFIQVYWHYFCQVILDHSTYLANELAWQEKMFPETNRQRLTFCNGVKGAWSSKLGSGYESDPAVTITRI